MVLGVVGVLAVLAPLIADESGLDATKAEGGRLEGPSWRFWLGTDEVGRSVLVLVLWGARVSLLVGLAATVLSVGLGALVGLVAGHAGGGVSWVLMRVTDWFLVLPQLVLAIALATVLGPTQATIIVAIALTSWASTARLVRAATLSVSTRGHVERAKALGAGGWHVVRRHVLPGVLPLIAASATLQVASSVLAEATLSFLGLGDPGRVSWGTMLSRAHEAGSVSYGAWWYLLPPGLAIIAVVAAFTVCGRALESAFQEGR
ncbi:binding-protein-dependent transport systems inner membrane component [Stackebrandtia nassauensis DSM 44728]|uniref:Binding-protein-dependent transport systems inner membrane component n=1 Tax=Stackebrandtia nassauensis (strain DSM 44728 / CIP 108903 / NRRL B-16338 / NBRC 102104 / LLR-40K-21) TaxID=446470 RepID=D3QBI6_STANL|nr:binding-protein-dependent transport systems inner membrane component [Stackebrandtia nassauensis DSM 44728]